MQEREFARLLREHAGLLSRVASSYEADPSLRDDLLQDMALALWRALPAWRGEASIKTFVARVAHNRSVNHVVRQKRQPFFHAVSEELPDLAPDPETRAQLDQKRLRLTEAVRALPVTLRSSVTLTFEGFSHQEIAEALGITPNNVAVRLNRARKALKVALGESA